MPSFFMRFTSSGPEFKGLAQSLGLIDCVKFPGHLPATQALKRGRLLVIPSRAESFPYVVLEAAAGQVPVVASEVGGIPEILPANDLLSSVFIYDMIAAFGGAEQFYSRFYINSLSLLGFTKNGKNLIFAMFVNDVPLPPGVTPAREGAVLGQLCEIIYESAP